MISIIILFFIILIFGIQPHHALRCYSCREKKQCGVSFSKNDAIRIIEGSDLYDSCSIIVDSNGITIRDMIQSQNCRSSSNQFCCNHDLCNSLPSPPLPAFTALTCAMSNCKSNRNQCNNSLDYVVYRSSATESCLSIHGDTVHKSYKMGCSPRRTRIKFANGRLISQGLYCCNYPECNQRILRPDEAIRCYTCDSRITGLTDCMILNTSSPYIYKSASSDSSDSCAMIVGLAGTDLKTGHHYLSFTIRTFIHNCVNQSFGNVTYGGAAFQGRIQCCSTSLCNIDPLYTNLSVPVPAHAYTISKIVVPISIACLGLIFVIIGITLSIYRFRWKKSNQRYIYTLSSDGARVTLLSSH
ncbi:unnamed protein product [Rotaria magnacalcarata]|uniref:Uncharacterized protein n=1 Tax=Rotaria magnacalcarata TaxID=392030 RepID=A0A816RRM5_9BILA|nr:unnamed protein product [Rotaria magnacalcarata]CAF2076595.1 unnamed protein product [Rotaria magnacalcarata]